MTNGFYMHHSSHCNNNADSAGDKYDTDSNDDHNDDDNFDAAGNYHRGPTSRLSAKALNSLRKEPWLHNSITMRTLPSKASMHTPYKVTMKGDALNRDRSLNSAAGVHEHTPGIRL